MNISLRCFKKTNCNSIIKVNSVFIINYIMFNVIINFKKYLTYIIWKKLKTLKSKLFNLIVFIFI